MHMKKTLYTIGVALLAMSMLSCSRDAKYTALPFVYFQNASMSVYEDAGEITIPVYANAETDFTLTFTTIDGVKEDPTTGLIVPNGTKGVDYEIVDNEAAILRFPQGTTQQDIKVKIIDFSGTLTGNKDFTIQIQSAGNEVSLGGYSSMKVTIIDNDHPLKSVFGEYTATDADGQSWTMTLAEDPKSYTSLFIDGIVPYVAGHWVGKNQRHYVEAPVNASDLKISVPLGYTLPDSLDGHDAVLYGYTPPSSVTGSGSIAMEKTDNGYKVDGKLGFVLIFEEPDGLYLAASNGMASAPITIVKK